MIGDVAVEMVMLTAAVTFAPVLSVTVSENEPAPAEVGIPERMPLGLNEIPGGIDPPEGTDQV